MACTPRPFAQAATAVSLIALATAAALGPPAAPASAEEPALAGGGARGHDTAAAGRPQLAQVLRREDPPETVTEERDSSPEHEDHTDPPEMDPIAEPTEFDADQFRGDPTYDDKPYDVEAQLEIYGGKTNFDAPRPVIEWGYPQYSEGPIGAGHNVIGAKNLVRPQLLVFGDWRTAIAYNDNGDVEKGLVATRLNLNADLRLTSTERIHASFGPFDQGGQFARHEFFGDDGDETDLVFDGNIDTLFIEGDVGAIQSGLTDEYAKYDLPFAAGLFPMFLQNGTWVDDAFIGAAAAKTAQNSRQLDITNYDVSAFFGLDKVTTNALKEPNGQLDDSAGELYAVATFMDVNEGYFEAGYGFIRDTRDGANSGFDYHNVTAAFTKRYGGWLSNSVRAIGNFGQDPVGDQTQTADGGVLIVENSLVTHKPLTLVPYGNAFVGLDRPQALARGGDGVAKNIGINFETDALTGFPKLDDSAQDAFGGAIGVEYLFDLSRQIVVEAATVQPFGGASDTIVGDQYAVGARYQHNLNDRWLFRTDVMHGWLRNAEDVSGVTFEVRRKF